MAKYLLLFQNMAQQRLLAICAYHYPLTIRSQLRQKPGRNIEPSAGILDSQSVKTTFGRGERGYDGAKKVVGRKRHILGDTQGFSLSLKVHPANISERELNYDAAPAQTDLG